MSTIAAPFVSVQEYLSTDYSPDVDYVDGELEDRNVGEKGHGKIQKALILRLGLREKELGVFVIQEQRVQISSTRFRVPDTCVMLGGEPDQEIFTAPPFLCVEVLSPDDRMSRMQRKISDYLRMGVRYVWVIDPGTRQAWVCDAQGMREVKDGVLRTADPEIAVPLAELFA
ncbi:MAG: Uma2 family endonuclease [Acidobacteria bacterium]|nr:Uma2 family endonuclease [Acidobacteriota bacterium]